MAGWECEGSKNETASQKSSIVSTGQESGVFVGEKLQKGHTYPEKKIVSDNSTEVLI